MKYSASVSVAASPTGSRPGSRATAAAAAPPGGHQRMSGSDGAGVGVGGAGSHTPLPLTPELHASNLRPFTT